MIMRAGAFRRAGVKMPPMDMFWGDRYCMVLDPFGHAGRSRPIKKI
jgi:uncharacterized glyoxalase superfamily protein PhnB